MEGHPLRLYAGIATRCAVFDARGTSGATPRAILRFHQAVKAWRAALEDAELPVLMVQLNRAFQPEDAVADRRWSQVPGVGVVYPQDHRVELALGRPLAGAATVHGGYGQAPETVPADMERFLPMLGCWGVAIG